MPAKSSKRTTEDRTRILIVDDHPLLREGVAQRINRETDLVVCAEAASAAEALEAVAAHEPDMAVVDISLGGKNGIELIKDLKVRQPKLPVIVLSVHDESLYAERALWAGARGYVMKQETTDALIQAIRRVRTGQVYVSERVAGKILNRIAGHRSGETTSPVDELSDRELEIFQLIGDGYSTGEIARRLHISPKTVLTHREGIKRKLSLPGAATLTRFAIHWARGERAPPPAKAARSFVGQSLPAGLLDQVRPSVLLQLTPSPTMDLKINEDISQTNRARRVWPGPNPSLILYRFPNRQGFESSSA